MLSMAISSSKTIGMLDIASPVTYDAGARERD